MSQFFNFPDALASIRATVLDSNNHYTSEVQFLLGAYNRFCCMGGPNFNPGTQAILDAVFQKSPKDALQLLTLAEKIALSRLEQTIDYRFFWDLFKSCNEDLEAFKQAMEDEASLYSIDLSEYIPERIKTELALP